MNRFIIMLNDEHHDDEATPTHSLRYSDTASLFAVGQKTNPVGRREYCLICFSSLFVFLPNS